MDIRHPASGGAEVYVHQLAKALTSMGDRVILISSWAQGLPNEEVIDGIHMIREGGRYTLYILLPKIYVTRLKGEVDVVVDEYTTAPFMTPLFVRERKVLLVHLLAGERIPYETPARLRFLSRVFQRIEGRILSIYRDIDVIAVSKSTAKELISIGLKKVHVVEPGVEPTLYGWTHKHEVPLVLYFGRIVPYKGVVDAVLAFHKVSKELGDARMIIAGKCSDDSFLNRIKGLLGQLGLTERVDIKLNVSEEEKRRLLESAWLLVLPSIKEGFNLVCLEAAASGTPVIGYNVPGIRDAVLDGETGILVPKKDVLELARTMKRILVRDEERELMKRKSREIALKFTWQRTAEKFRSVILANE